MNTTLLLTLLTFTGATVASGQMRAGFAEREVRPDPGMEVPGGYGKAFAKEIHDPPKVRAAVFDDGKKRVALVGLDALAIRRDTAQQARREITAKTGIPAECVLLTASHSHTSGPTVMVLPGEYDHASPLVQELAYQKSSAADPKYLERFVAGIVDAVVAADQARAECQLSFGVGKEDKVAFNRRQRMKNGLSYSHAGRGNPDIVDYAGPIDPDVGVIGAWSKDGKPLGVVVNFSCHATTGPAAFSANWIYFLEKTIRGGLGADIPVVFLQGACGDITQVDNLDPFAPKNGDFYAQLIGGCVGAEALKILFRAERSAGPFAVETKGKTWRIPRRVPEPGKVLRSLELVKKHPKEVGTTEWLFAKETVLLDALLAKEKDMEVEVQAVQVGPVVCFSTPAEYFVEFGLEFKKRGNFPITFPVELTNGCVGYVPTEAAFGEHGGGYETRLTSYSNLEISAGRQMLEAGLELAKQLTPSPLPERAKAGPFKEPWSYGAVPPETK
jgi:neutral ceramidase